MQERGRRDGRPGRGGRGEPGAAGGVVAGREPMILVHGFTSSGRAWDPVVPALAAHHDLLAVTLDGHRGGRPIPRRVVPDAAFYADGVERDMDAAGIDRARIVGNSLGGWIALLLAARGRASSVVCLAPAGGWRTGGAFELSLFARFGVGVTAFRAIARHGDLLRRPGVRGVVLGALVARPRAVPARAAVQLVEDGARCPAFLPSLLTLDRQRLRDLGAVDSDVRIAWSGEDRILSERRARARFAELVPNAEQLVLPGVGHVPMWDDPVLVAETVLAVTAPGRGVPV